MNWMKKTFLMGAALMMLMIATVPALAQIDTVSYDAGFTEYVPAESQAADYETTSYLESDCYDADGNLKPDGFYFWPGVDWYGTWVPGDWVPCGSGVYLEGPAPGGG